MKIFILLILIAAISACQQNAPETKNQAAKPTPGAADSSVPDVAPPDALVSPIPPKNGNYNGKGVVKKINLELVSVELDHEEIGELMPAMVMEFYVADKAELEKLKIGDKVDFVLEYKDGQEKIVSIEKAK